MPAASLHYWLALAGLGWSCVALILAATALPALAFLPAATLIAAAIKGVYWLAGLIDRHLPTKERTCGIDLGKALTSWLKELADSSFAWPGGFSIIATLRSADVMLFNKDDPSLTTLGLGLSVYWLLLVLALPVCAACERWSSGLEA